MDDIHVAAAATTLCLLQCCHATCIVLDVLQRRRHLSTPRIPTRHPLFEKVLDNADDYYDKCRMNITHAQQLCRVLGHNTDSDADHHSQHFKYSAFSRLTAFLCQMAHNYHYRDLRVQFDWSKDSILTNFNYWVDQIITVLNADDSPDRIRLWCGREFQDFRDDPHVALFKDCIGCVDTISIQLYRPDNSALHSRCFSWHKKVDALFFTVICDRSGRIRYVDDGTPTRRQSDQLSIGRAHLKLPADLFLLGDGHYNHNRYCKSPYHYGELRRASSADLPGLINWNRMLRSQRILIEWIFGRIRGSFGIFAVKYSYDYEPLPFVFRAACLLYNYICRVYDEWPGRNQYYYRDADSIPPRPEDFVSDVPQPLPDRDDREDEYEYVDNN